MRSVISYRAENMSRFPMVIPSKSNNSNVVYGGIRPHDLDLMFVLNEELNAWFGGHSVIHAAGLWVKVEPEVF